MLIPQAQADLEQVRDHEANAAMRERAARRKIAAGRVAHQVALHGLRKPRDPDTVDPWLNPIKTLWRWLRQDVIKRHRRAGDFGRWRAAVSGYPDQFGEPSSAPLHSCGRVGDGRLALALGAA